MDGPRITPLYTSRLSWVLIPGPCDYRHYRYAEAVIEKLCCATTGKGFLLVLADNGWCEERARKMAHWSL